MSKLGSAIVFSAEAAIWIAGAALIASAAGMHWRVDIPTVDLGAVMGPKPSATASGSPAPTSAATLTRSPKPGSSPTAAPSVSPIAAKYQAP